MKREIKESTPAYFRVTMWDKMQFLIRKVADQQIRGIIYFDGKIDEQVMKRAVRLSIVSEPILNCRYMETKSSPRWDRVPGEDHEICELLMTTDADSEIKHFLMQEIDPFKSPQIKVLIIRDLSDILCINMNHAVGDASGLKDYLYLLSSIYNNLIADKNYAPKPNIKGSRSLWQVGRHLTLFQKARVVRQSLTKPRPVLDWKLPLVRVQNEDKFILMRKLPIDSFRIIRKYAKQHNGTVNDVILAAYFRALHRMIHPESGTSMRVFATVDLRRYIPSGKAAAMCNLSSSIYPNIGTELGATLNETITRVVIKMNEIKGDLPGLAPFPSLAIPFKIFPYARLKKMVQGQMGPRRGSSFPPGFTNLGTVDSGKLVFPGVNVKDAFLTGAVNYPPAFQLGFSSFKESLTFSVCSCGREANGLIASSALDYLWEELPK